MVKSALLALVLPLLQAAAPELTANEEMRAQSLMREIRCAACENEPISQSAADIAGHMRERVRTLVAEGASDQDVRDWFAERYGEFVLFRPQAEGPSGWLLWGAPFVLLVSGTAIVIALARKRRSGGPVDTVAPEDASP
ncbi:MAG: cytochrome c-type biogenesis protein [Pseudomonadota bacterium]